MNRSHGYGAVAVILLLFGCEQATESTAVTLPRVKYFVVGEHAQGQSRRISGKVIAAEIAPLSFGIGGTVEEILVERGDRVRAGQLLARLDATPLRLAVEGVRAQLVADRARVRESAQALERTRTLYAQGAIAQAEVETATANHATARGQLRTTASELQRKERDLAHAELLAPFAGIVSERAIEPFQELSVGQEALVLQAANNLNVAIRVPETLIREVDYGQVVQVHFPTLNEATVAGTVSIISSSATSGNAFPVEIHLAGSGLDLRPGMTAGVTFNFDRYLQGRTVFVIPLSALAVEVGLLSPTLEADRANRVAHVYTYAESGRLALQRIVVGGVRGNMIEVYEGLAPGDKVISAGVALLREGMRVELWSTDG